MVMSSSVRTEANNLSTRKQHLSRKQQKSRRKRKKQDIISQQQPNDQPNQPTSQFLTTVITTDKSEQHLPFEAAVPVDELLKQSKYIPAPLPKQERNSGGGGGGGAIVTISKQKKGKTLGKWFPSALKFKSTTAEVALTAMRQHHDNNNNNDNDTTTPPTTCSLLLFYQYVSPVWDEQRVQQLVQYLTNVHEHRSNMAGRIRVAPEGLNATLTAIDVGTHISAAVTLRHFAQDLCRFDPLFAQTDFKYTDGLHYDRHFTQLVLLPVKELVYYGLRGDQEAPISSYGATHVSAEQFHHLLAGDKEKETVVVDVRNHYEAAIGRFDGQEIQNGSQTTLVTPAKYIDPKMRKSTDFPGWLKKPETQEMLAGKRVLLYCTGGIRCERASAHLNLVTKGSTVPSVNTKNTDKSSPNDSTNHNTQTQLSKAPAEIYQLQGGIERYLKAFPDGGFWRGKNFCFDKREAVSADNPNGDGGVVRRHTNAQSKAQLSVKVATPDSICVICAAPWDRYIGKKHCECCGVPVLCCDSCLSDKSKMKGQLLRCPLCVEQNVTVAARDVEWTNNGVNTVVVTVNKESCDRSDTLQQKAAPSVLKWGGGHAADKKRKRRLQSKPCHFGSDCQRPDCLFAHPNKNVVNL